MLVQGYTILAEIVKLQQQCMNKSMEMENLALRTQLQMMQAKIVSSSPIPTATASEVDEDIVVLSKSDDDEKVVKFAKVSRPNGCLCIFLFPHKVMKD